MEDRGPRPAANPHLLKPSRYVPTLGKRVDWDTLPPPKYTPAKGKYVVAGPPRIIKTRASNFVEFDPPARVPGKGKVWSGDSLAPPDFFPIAGDTIPTRWPTWRPASFEASKDFGFAYMTVEQGLYVPFIKAMLEDQRGHIWMAHHGGALGQWDGRGYAHYSVQEGLRMNEDINCLLEDRQGRIWMGANNIGIGVWDGQTFVTYPFLPQGTVFDLLEDEQGNIWLGTDKGMAKWSTSGFFLYREGQGLINPSVNDLMQDRSGRLWVATDGGASVWDGQNFTHFTSEEGLPSDRVFSLAEDQQGHIWLGTADGLARWTGQAFLHYPSPGHFRSLAIQELFLDSKGRIWFETRHANDGVGVWDPAADRAGFYHYTQSDGLSNEGPYSFLEDRAGRIWIGSEGGITLVDGQSFQIFSEERLKKINVHSLLEDSQGQLWLGTGTAGIFISSAEPGYGSDTFHQYTSTEGLSGGWVTDMLEARDGRIWIATRGGGISVWDGKGFTRFSRENGLSVNDVRSLFQARDGRIWIGTSSGGIYVYDGKGFTQLPTVQGAGRSAFSILEDRDGRIWTATYNGVLVWDEEEVTHFTTQHGLGDDRIWNLIEDDRGHIWIGTNDGGVHVWDGKGMYQYTMAGGLSQNIGRSLTQAGDGTIWIGTFRGLNRLSPTAHDDEWLLTTFDQNDGLPSVSIHSTLLGRQGNLWLGTAEGPSWLDLHRSPSDSSRPTVFLRTLQPFFETLDWRAVQDSLEKQAEPDVQQRDFHWAAVSFDSVRAFTNLPIDPVFPHDINDLTFHWSGAHTVAPHKLLYSYWVEGNSDYWSPAGPEAFARLQNLRPGDYTFHLRAVGVNGQWGEPVSYPFSIRPPWWASIGAYITYILAGLALFYALYRYQLNRRLVEAEALRLRELDTFKSRLYTNITHEFRTPLTVIMGMVDQIKGQERIKQLIRRNGHDLLNLVNQMLDLRKLEVGGLELQLVQADVIPFLSYLLESFHSVAASKDIQLAFQTSVERSVMDHDPERLRQVMSNLLSNAIKFTPSGGQVSCTVQVTDGADEGQYVCISVNDSGVGIPEADLPRLFDRFYQSDNSATRQAEGTGIGLALAKDLVEAMGGTISVASQPGQGSSFRIVLPVTRKAASPTAPTYLGNRGPGKERALPIHSTGKAAAELPLALIVEDNRDVAYYLKECLRGNYRVHWARNGQEGLEQARARVPDIIISDVMMPELDGFELCQILKTDIRTSHIPIILLTARATHEDRLHGLDKGADAYLMKPFQQAELEIRLRKLIALRRALRDRYRDMDLENVSPDYEIDPEVQFLKRLERVVLDNLSDENFKVEPHLCRAMTMSRPQLYRKLKALKGVSPSMYMRHLRMRKAQRLLLRHDRTIAEVAEAVGFKDPSYFSKVYAATFGELPSQTQRV